MATLGSDSTSGGGASGPDAARGGAVAGAGNSTGASELRPGGTWRLLRPLDGYSSPCGGGLATQIRAGRGLRLLDVPRRDPTAAGVRLRVRLLEDGYPCWLGAADLLAAAQPAPAAPRRCWNRAGIEVQLPAVLRFALAALQQPNRYLWGGSLGPDYDCSGLVQAAFAQTGIWLPRDACLQERFCQPVAVRIGHTGLLQPGDLIFFGSQRRCSHVGLHLGEGRYLHSSGRQHGRDGIGIDDLHPRSSDPVACHYRRQLRGAGRVMHSHDGSPLPP